MEYAELLAHLLALRDLARDDEDTAAALERLPRDRATADSKLARARDAAHDAATAVHQAAHEERRIDARLRELDALRRRYEGQVPQARTHEALGALQHQLATLAREQADLEDAGLRLIDQAEEARRLAARRADELAAEEARHAEAGARLDARATELAAHRDLLQRELQNRLASLPDEERRLWETVARRHGGRGAIVPLMGGTRCGGCDMQVVLNTREGVLSAHRLTRCEQCGRILFDPDRFG